MRILTILAAVPVLLLGCEARVTLHHFVIPQGYTGPIAVVSDPGFSGGGGHWEQERYVHLVPRTAVVCVSPEGRLGAHLLSAEYSDGSTIYSYGEGRIHPPNETSIRIESFGGWHGSTDYSSVIWLGVGDAATVEALKNSFFGGGIEKLMPRNVLIEKFDSRVGFKQLSPYCESPNISLQRDRYG